MCGKISITLRNATFKALHGGFTVNFGTIDTFLNFSLEHFELLSTAKRIHMPICFMFFQQTKTCAHHFTSTGIARTCQLLLDKGVEGGPEGLAG